MTTPKRPRDRHADTVPVWEMRATRFDHSLVECDHCGHTIEAGDLVIHAELPASQADARNTVSHAYHLRCAMALSTQLAQAVNDFAVSNQQTAEEPG